MRPRPMKPRPRRRRTLGNLLPRTEQQNKPMVGTKNPASPKVRRRPMRTNSLKQKPELGSKKESRANRMVLMERADPGAPLTRVRANLPRRKEETMKNLANPRTKM